MLDLLKFLGAYCDSATITVVNYRVAHFLRLHYAQLVGDVEERTLGGSVDRHGCQSFLRYDERFKVDVLTEMDHLRHPNLAE